MGTPVTAGMMTGDEASLLGANDAHGMTGACCGGPMSRPRRFPAVTNAPGAFGPHVSAEGRPMVFTWYPYPCTRPASMPSSTIKVAARIAGAAHVIPRSCITHHLIRGGAAVCPFPALRSDQDAEQGLNRSALTPAVPPAAHPLPAARADRPSANGSPCRRVVVARRRTVRTASIPVVRCSGCSSR